MLLVVLLIIGLTTVAFYQYRNAAKLDIKLKETAAKLLIKELNYDKLKEAYEIKNDIDNLTIDDINERLQQYYRKD